MWNLGPTHCRTKTKACNSKQLCKQFIPTCHARMSQSQTLKFELADITELRPCKRSNLKVVFRAHPNSPQTFRFLRLIRKFLNDCYNKWWCGR